MMTPAATQKRIHDPERGEVTSHVSSSSSSATDSESDDTLSKDVNEGKSLEVVYTETSVSPESTTTVVRSNKDKKMIALIVGIVLLLGVAVAIVILVDFMREGDIHFLQSNNGDASTSSSMTVITPEELALHDSEDDCWVALYGEVYDFTRYARRHPNGPEDIVELAGTDGTAAYAREHSIGLLRAVQRDIVGRLSTAAEDSYQNTVDESNWKDYGSSHDSSSGSSSSSSD